MNHEYRVTSHCFAFSKQLVTDRNQALTRCEHLPEFTIYLLPWENIRRAVALAQNWHSSPLDARFDSWIVFRRAVRGLARARQLARRRVNLWHTHLRRIPSSDYRRITTNKWRDAPHSLSEESVRWVSANRIFPGLFYLFFDKYHSARKIKGRRCKFK